MRLKKIKSKKIELVLLTIVTLQIFLLINLVPANSYVLRETDSSIENIKTVQEEDRLRLKEIFSLNIFGSVSAQEFDVCCEKTKERSDGTGGAWCQNAPQNECNTNFKIGPPNKLCDDTTFCKSGYCFDPEEGLCSEGSSEEECESEGGEWDENYDSAKCDEGCCVLGINTQFVTETRCDLLSSEQGSGYFDRSISEIECRFFLRMKVRVFSMMGGVNLQQR